MVRIGFNFLNRNNNVSNNTAIQADKTGSTIFSRNVRKNSSANAGNNDKEIVKRTFYPNGEPKSETFSDGSTVTYSTDGKIIQKTYNKYDKKTDKNKKIELLYRDDGSLKQKGIYSDDGHLEQRSVYKNDKILLTVKYDEEGKVIDTIKNLPRGEIDFNEDLLNGEFDADFSQGVSGVCYLASGVKGLMQTEEGRELLKEALSYDESEGVGTVNFKGLDKSYSFTKAEIKKGMTRLGTGDPDFTLLCLGYEKYREEQGKQVDLGHATDLLDALGARNSFVNYDTLFGKVYRINNEMLNDFKTVMKSGHGFACAGTWPELPKEATDKELHAGHDYYIKQINNDGTITVSDVLVKKDIVLKENEFKEYFGILEFADLSEQEE